MSFSPGQSRFLKQALEGRNLFLTGKAGTGKSFVIKESIRQLQAMKKRVVALAPTGIAANNIGGQTIHSLFGINPFGIASFETCNYWKSDKRAMMKKIDVIVIDEVSMLRPDVLDAMHWSLLKNGCPGLTTKQIIFIGDLKQLPPVLNDNTRSVLYQTYDGEWFHYAKIYDRLGVIDMELTDVLRQSDPDFIDNLNIIRDGGKAPYFRRFLSPDADGIILAPYNDTVQEYNEAGLRAQSGELLEFAATIEGAAKITDFNLEAMVQVKNGCKIMYLVNSKDNPLVNGTIGTFVSHAGCHYIRVNNTDFALERVTLTKKEYVYDETEDAITLREVGSISQYPIKLAYALSIHKSQGLTFDKVTIDLRRPCFHPSQYYVALSRVTGPDGLRIRM